MGPDSVTPVFSWPPIGLEEVLVLLAVVGFFWGMYALIKRGQDQSMAEHSELLSTIKDLRKDIKEDREERRRDRREESSEHRDFGLAFKELLTLLRNQDPRK